ncbi:hypothetical protein PLESTB_001270600 [Pleodorina starrii]|uniref:Ankyrin repeat domain-containing protein n=1 Tax=Pleodorina starrii TaxID=330485 RepID=A0A9W6F611_9CHLO|nr:hypothetical protein PLESTB_001270600 [Pleodorina starrii]
MTPRRQLVCLTAASGRLDNLEVAIAAANCALTGKMLEAAAAAGQLHACQSLRDRGCPWGDSLLQAARAGHRDTCEWLLAAGCPWSPDAVYAAASGGHPDLMDWLLLLQHRNKPPTPASPRVVAAALLLAAAAGLDLAALQQLHGKWVKGPDDGRSVRHIDRWEWCHIVAAAAGSPAPDWRAKVEWLEAQLPEACEPSPDAVWRAAVTATAIATRRKPPGGHKENDDDADALSRLAWLRQRGYPLLFDRKGIDEVAGRGHVAVLTYLLADSGVDNPPLFAAAVAEAAAAHGLLKVLEELRVAGRLFGVGGGDGGGGTGFGELARAAARGGQPKILRWLLLQAAAAGPGGGGGGGDIVRPIAGELLTLAAGCGNVELLALLFEGGEGGDQDDDDGNRLGGRAEGQMCRVGGSRTEGRMCHRGGGRADGGGGGSQAAAAAATGAKQEPSGSQAGDGREGRGQQRRSLLPLLRLLRDGREALEAAVTSGCEEAMDWVADSLEAAPAAGREMRRGCCCVGSLGPEDDPIYGELCFLAARNDDLAALHWLLTTRLRYQPTEADFARCVVGGRRRRCGTRGGGQGAAAAASAGGSESGCGGGGGGWDWEAAARRARSTAARRAGEEPQRVCLWLDEFVRMQQQQQQSEGEK